MKFYSTENKSSLVFLKEAVLKGMPADNGLFMPQKIPVLPKGFFDSISKRGFQEISLQIAKAFFGEDLSAEELEQIVTNAINFDAPLIHLHDNIYSLELYHGPTLAFKDFGARFMARMMAGFVKNEDRELSILVATSGDTGSAVANGFYDVPGIKVIILYPSGKISDIQEKQIATLDKNIISLEIDGVFDDCQKLVKQAFLDKELNSAMMLSSANSINIARLIPQSFYYFYAYAQLNASRTEKVVVSVPSGNFGNLTAGLIAKRMGLPVQQFIASTNVNDVVPEYLKTGLFSPRASIQTISNAMDVGYPSNFVRILDMYGSNYNKILQDVSGTAYTDEQTRQMIRDLAKENKYFLDPHGAVGYMGLKHYLALHPDTAHGIFIETAHPAKFIDVVGPLIESNLEIPERLSRFLNMEKRSVKLKNDYEEFKNFLLA